MIAEVTWPASRLGEAIEALGRHAGFEPRGVEVPPPPFAKLTGAYDEIEALEQWIDGACAWLGLEAESVYASYSGVTELIRDAAPALLSIPAVGDGEQRFLLLLGRAPPSFFSREARVHVLGPDLRVHTIAVEPVRAAVCARMESFAREANERLLDAAGVSPRRRPRALRVLFEQRLGGYRVAGCWLLRMDPGSDVARQFRRAGVGGRLARMMAAQLALYAFTSVAWVVLGRGALQGTLDRGWLLGWALALVTALPLQLLASWHGARLALDAGAVFKQRLLAGAIRLDPESVRHEGAGAMLGRVIESSAVEAGALSGAMASVAAIPEVFAAVAVLWVGLGGPAHAAVYLAWLALAIGLGVRYGLLRREWTRARVAMTNDLVERMVGHRTRLAQEAPERWHDGEDKSLERYLDASARLDRYQVLVSVVVPRGWTLLGMLGVAIPMLSAATTPAALVVSIGAVVLAGHALRAVTGGLNGLVGAAVAWREVSALFHAAARREAPGAPIFALQGVQPRAVSLERGNALVIDAQRTVLEAHDLVFRHQGRAEPVLKGVSLRVQRGDRILLEGPSGGGKSTLGAVIAGLRSASSGLLLLHGLDARSLGAEAWRRRVVTAPQFHENHVMTHTVAFNLLMGRRWPPSESDLEDAEALCRALDLGPLLDRMPSGLQQMVGESGWRLSHGEQSRIFMARALLQGAEVVVLDESFAALDPETLRKALECALERCPSLVVIAHP